MRVAMTRSASDLQRSLKRRIHCSDEACANKLLAVVALLRNLLHVRIAKGMLTINNVAVSSDRIQAFLHLPS